MKTPLAEFKTDPPHRRRHGPIPHYATGRELRAEFTSTPLRDPALSYRPCLHLTWRCANEHCRQWTMNGSWLTGRCNFCFTPRPQ